MIWVLGGCGGGTGSTTDGGTGDGGTGQCLGIFESCMFGGIPCCAGLICGGNFSG